MSSQAKHELDLNPATQETKTIDIKSSYMPKSLFRNIQKKYNGKRHLIPNDIPTY